MSPLTWIDRTVKDLSCWRLVGIDVRPPTETDFRQMEAMIGGYLPAEYRHFVAKVGGYILGDLQAKVVAPVADRCPWGPYVPIEFVFPAVVDHPDSAARQMSHYRDKLPRGMLPIADYAARKVVCLDVAGAYPGTVWMWRSQPATPAAVSAARAPEVVRPAEYRALYRMSTSFAELLRSAHRVPH